jgi:hypothetical protein
MIYETDGNFLTKDSELFEKFFTVTVLTISKFCYWYWDGQKACRFEDQKEFRRFLIKKIEYIFSYLKDNPHAPFVFMLDEDNPKKVWSNGIVCKFDHHDDACCWAFNLNEKEYEALQQALKNENFPIDLIIPGNTH